MPLWLFYIEEESYIMEIGNVIKENAKRYDKIRSMSVRHGIIPERFEIIMWGNLNDLYLHTLLINNDRDRVHIMMLYPNLSPSTNGFICI